MSDERPRKPDSCFLDSCYVMFFCFKNLILFEKIIQNIYSVSVFTKLCKLKKIERYIQIKVFRRIFILLNLNIA